MFEDAEALTEPSDIRLAHAVGVARSFGDAPGLEKRLVTMH